MASLKSRTTIVLKADKERKFFSKQGAMDAEMAAGSVPLGSVKNRQRRVYPASNYTPVAYRGQTIGVAFRKDGVSISCNRKDSLVQEYPIKKGHFNSAMIHDALESYRNSHLLMKCGRYKIKVANTGVIYNTQKAFLEGYDFSAHNDKPKSKTGKTKTKVKAKSKSKTK